MNCQHMDSISSLCDHCASEYVNYLCREVRLNGMWLISTGCHLLVDWSLSVSVRGTAKTWSGWGSNRAAIRIGKEHHDIHSSPGTRLPASFLHNVFQGRFDLDIVAGTKQFLRGQSVPEKLPHYSIQTNWSHHVIAILSYNRRQNYRQGRARQFMKTPMLKIYGFFHRFFLFSCGVFLKKIPGLSGFPHIPEQQRNMTTIHCVSSRISFVRCPKWIIEKNQVTPNWGYFS